MTERDEIVALLTRAYSSGFKQLPGWDSEREADALLAAGRRKGDKAAEARGFERARDWAAAIVNKYRGENFDLRSIVSEICAMEDK